VAQVVPRGEVASTKLVAGWKHMGNLNKQHFLMVGSSFGFPWFFFGFSLVFYKGAIGKVQGWGILTKVLFNEISSQTAFFEKNDPNTIRDKEYSM